jgi:uncharacterized repeat protein (TIGR01451 family)
MNYPRLLTACLLLLLLTANAASQESPVSPDLNLSSHDRRAALIPAGSTTTEIELLADPASGGGDLFDVASFDPNTSVTLVTPAGVEVGVDNAAALGFKFFILPEWAAAKGLLSALLSPTGTNTLIELPPSSSPGTYKVKVVIPAATTNTPVFVTYVSSTPVRVGLTTSAASYRAGDTVVLVAGLFDQSPSGDAIPITGATVMASVVDSARVDATPVEVVLLDSGPYDDAPGDGIYTGFYTSSQAGEFVAAVGASGVSASGVNFSRSAGATFEVLSPLASFTSFQNSTVDEDSDGLFEKLVVTALVNVQTPGEYRFTATLAASNGEAVKESAAADLGAGQQQISLQFSAAEVLGLNAGGPFKIKDATLFFVEGQDASMADYRADAGDTPAYQPSQFSNPVRTDLAITSVSSSEQALVNEPFTYTLVIYNAGASPATGVIVSDNLPSGLVPASASSSHGTCGNTAPVICELGALDSQSTAQVTLTVVPAAPGSVSNTASVTSSASDLDPSNNTAVVETTVVAPAEPSAVFVAADKTTQGNWRGSYGAEGHNVVNDSESYPAYAAVSVTGHNPYTFAASTDEARAPQKADGSGRIAAGWYSGGSFIVDLNLRDGQAHRVALYVMDWDLNGRAEKIEILDASSGALLGSRDVSAYSHGQYLIWKMSGHVQVRVTKGGPSNAVINALFFDPATAPPPPTPTYALSGVIKDGDGNPLSGATVTLSGDATRTATTGGDGRYAFTQVAGGQDYTVTPSGAYAPFTPASRSVTYLSSDAALDFTGTAALRSSGKLAFVGIQSGLYNVAVVNGDGTGRRTLTLDRASNYSPAWSPDGTRIAFVNDKYEWGATRHRIYVMDSDGGNRRRLTYTAAADEFAPESYTDPVWSPDGTKIAFLSNLDVQINQSRLYVMNANGTNITRLSNGLYAGRPTWSPDGTKLAFGDAGVIKTVNADGTGETVISGANDSAPAWSPDGSQIAFVSYRNNYDAEIYSMSPDGANQRRLTDSEGPDDSPSWSPSGAKIAFVRSPSYGDKDVYVMNADGSAQTNLTATPGADFDPAWSPDGTKIAFASWRDQAGVYVMNADGTAQTGLAADGEKPAWQPDGSGLPPAPTEYSIRVHVEHVDGYGLNDITINLSGTQTAHATTDDNGDYLVWGLPAGGSYTITPAARYGYVFTPASLTFNNLSRDETADFSAADPPEPTPTPTPTPTPSADLSITNAASSNPAELERVFAYNITVTNTGPLAATGAVVTDALPSGVTFFSATPTQGSCAVASGTMTCQLGSLASGGSAGVTLQVKPRLTGSLGNTAVVTAAESDPNGSNNSATAQTTVIKTADLKVTNTDSADPIFVGDQVTYTMLVTNLGQVNGATSVVLTDSLPVSLIFVSATTTQGSLVTPSVGSTGVVTANLGLMAVNAQATITVTAKATQAGTVTSTATVSADETDPNTTNNAAAQSTLVKAASVASLQKVLLAKQVMTGGCESTTGQVYLTSPAPTGGVSVMLSSNISGVTVATYVDIPGGSTVSPAFTVTTNPVTAKQVGLVTATSGPNSVSRGVTINVGGGACP